MSTDTESTRLLLAGVATVVPLATFLRSLLETQTRSGRAKQLNISLANLKTWMELRNQESSPIKNRYLEDQTQFAFGQVVGDATALRHTSRRQAWLLGISAAFAVAGLLLTIFKLDAVVAGSGWASWAWWVAYGVSAVLVTWGLLTNRTQVRMEGAKKYWGGYPHEDGNGLKPVDE